MIRTLFILGRVSNLPTIWTNCLCAWLLTGSGNRNEFVVLTVAVSIMYVGGMFLNDYCDSDLDKQCRPERPIPMGEISRMSVLKIAVVMILSGIVLTGLAGLVPLMYGVILGLLIFIYNLYHEKNPVAPFLMGGCRSCVYLIVGAAANSGVTLPVIVAAAVMFLFVAGISFTAKKESKPGRPSVSAISWIFLPFSLLIYVPMYPLTMSFSALTAIVSVIALALVFRVKRSPGQMPSRLVGWLLAGIAIVDLMIVARFGHFSKITAIVFVSCFVVGIVGQKPIPAT